MIEYNGIWYARVSEVLNKFSDFTGIDEKVLKNKQDVGTSVHKAIEQDIEGRWPYVSKATEGYFDSYLLWKKHLDVKFLCSETRYYHKEKRLTGQIDALMLPPGSNLPVIVDFKTSANASEIVWELQAHLYAFLIMSEGKQISNHYLFVKLDKKGNLPKVYKYAFDENALALGLSAVDDYWKNQESKPLSF